MKKKRYTTEFKREAARLMIMEGARASEVAEKLGVKTGLLYRWKSEHLGELDGATTVKSGSSATQLSAEIDQLRKQLARERRINEILKKR